MEEPSFLVKLQRAAKHIQELESACQSFLDSHPYTVRADENPHTGERDLYFLEVRDVPANIGSICGDALQNMRSALDHLAWRLVELAGNTPAEGTAFPIAKDCKRYRSAETRRKVQGMGKDMIDAIDAFKPYKGGNDTLWRLHALNNFDKHRLLIAVCVAHFENSLTPIWSLPRKPPSPVERWAKIKTVRMLKSGDVIRNVPKLEVNQYMSLQSDIVFDKSGIADGESVIETLHQINSLVTKIIAAFGPW